jgi:hypothetical protein
MSIGPITAAALMPAKPVPRPAPIPARRQAKIFNNISIINRSKIKYLLIKRAV